MSFLSDLIGQGSSDTQAGIQIATDAMKNAERERMLREQMQLEKDKLRYQQQNDARNFTEDQRKTNAELRQNSFQTIQSLFGNAPRYSTMKPPRSALDNILRSVVGGK